jgi:multidrug efflux system outer membrane protein
MSRAAAATLASGAILAGVVLAGCVLEPKYQRPPAPVPAAWPTGPAYDALAGTPAAATPVQDWREVFPDPKLRRVIVQALASSRDLKVAIGQIQASRAQYHVQRAALLPTIDASANPSLGRSFTGFPPSLGAAYENYKDYSVSVGTTSYELDLFGRVRSLTKAALQSYLATEEARRSTQISLVAEVASDYLTYAADSSLLAVSKNTVTSAQANVDLARRRMAGGVASQLDVSSAETIVEEANDDVARYTTQVAQDLNALDLAVGAPVAPGDLPTGVDDPAARLGAAPSALDSQILLQRPDVVEAEHTLRSANADIGAARAAFFPKITLTGSAGTETASLASLFAPGSGVWSFGPTISVPIFDGGVNKGNLAYARAEDRIDVAQYEKAIQTAFREVADALAQRGTIAARLRALNGEVAAAAESLKLARALYARGSDSYLDVLTAERTLYGAQQSLIAVQLIDQTNIVTLYKVLGGSLSDRTAGT